MEEHGLLLACHSGRSKCGSQNGRIAVDRSNLRCCSDAFELGCDCGAKVRIAFALDCYDREAFGYVATTEGIKSTVSVCRGRLSRTRRPLLRELENVEA